MNKEESHRFPLLRKALLLGLSVLILLVSSEMLFGLAFWIKDRSSKVSPLRFPVDHPYTYFSFAADPGRITNEDGLYTKIPRTKAPNKFRIVLVGGSVARSSQGRLRYEQTISYNLERELNSRLNTSDIEVINAGMTAYVAEQEFILIQSVLQKYQPDMIISLDGYNDLLSFMVNPLDGPPSTPLFYSQFRVIDQAQEQQKFSYRLRVCFKNIFRAKDLFANALWGEEQRDYSKITEVQFDQAAEGYLSILRDMKDFTSAKKIAFYSFLQPVRWYAPNDPNHARFNITAQLARLYGRYDDGFKKMAWGDSLTAVLESNLDLYFDDCHVEAKGNEIMAAAMADFLAKKLVKESGKLMVVP